MTATSSICGGGDEIFLALHKHRASQTQLCDLPVELLQQIACLLDARSVLDFTKTCRQIRAACYTEIVFKTVLERSSSEYSAHTKSHDPTTSTRSRPLLQGIDLDDVSSFAGNDATAWADIALADYQALLEVGSKSNAPFKSDDTESKRFSMSGSIDSLLRAAPHLVFLKHPIVSSEAVASHVISSTLLFRRVNLLNDPVMGLWYCASMMSYQEDASMPPNGVTGAAHSILDYFMKQPDSPMKQHGMALFGLGAAAAVLRGKFALIRPMGSQMLATPTLADMSLITTRTKQLPPFYVASDGVSKRRWSSWLHAYIRDLSRREYIEDPLGWSCYCFGEGNNIDFTIEYEWRDIRFKVQPSEFTKWTLTIQSVWDQDGGGIYGWIREDTGYGLALFYDSSEALIHSWELAMTPFGLFGLYDIQRPGRSPFMGRVFKRPSMWEIEFMLKPPKHATGVFWMWKQGRSSKAPT